MESKPTLILEHVTKSFGEFTAVSDLSLQVRPGRVFGLIGPNGAGKTTTIKMIATLLKPTSGTAYIDGIDVCKHPDEIRRVLGYMPDFFGVYDDVKVW